MSESESESVSESAPQRSSLGVIRGVTGPAPGVLGTLGGTGVDRRTRGLSWDKRERKDGGLFQSYLIHLSERRLTGMTAGLLKSPPLFSFGL